MSTPTAPALDPVLARMGELLGLPVVSEVDVFELARAGLTAETWTHVAATVPMPRDLFVRADYARLMVTLGRRFTPAETELILRVVRLFAQACVAHGSSPAAGDWLSAPVSLRPGQPAVAPWTLATTETGARLCERLLGIGTSVPATPAHSFSDIDVDALVCDDANMSAAELDWAAALEEQRAAGVVAAAVDNADTPDLDIDIDAVIGDVAVDPHELDWAAALAEQAAAGNGAEAASMDDADAILAAAAAESNR